MLLKISVYLILLIMQGCSSWWISYHNNPPEIQHVDFLPGPRPSRIILTFEENPATSATVTWRTNSNGSESKAEIVAADPSPYFNDHKTSAVATSTQLKTQHGEVIYHKAQFTGLEPATTYLYRVVTGQYQSEWFQFTTASTSDQPFRFIYMGDAQKRIFSHVSRVMRAAYAKAPDASFVLHTGDLVDHADNDYEWEEWFHAGSFIHAQIPVVALPGNHEYNKNLLGQRITFSKYWNPQFNFPDNHPIEALDDQTYYFDYQQIRFVALNSNRYIEEQSEWLDRVLKESNKKWNILSFHHPLQNAVKRRQNQEIRKRWKPVIEKHSVDLVLQGHDHSYARGYLDDEESGTICVVSVAGKKMYNLDKQAWMARKGENTQLFQIIELTGDTLQYTCYTPSGKIYDSFLLQKQQTGNNILVETGNDFPVERIHENTLREN